MWWRAESQRPHTDLRKLLALVIVVLVLAGVDMAARVFAESRIEEAVEAEARGVASVNVRIDALPFVPRLLLGVQVPEVSVRLEQVPSRAITLTAVEIELREVEVDRASVVRRDPRLKQIEGGTLTVELDGSSLTNALRVPISIREGRVRVGAGRAAVTLRPTTAAGALVLGVGASALRVAVPRTRLLTCDATRASVSADRIELSCDFREVPPALAG
jgi:hypothetical protein